MGSSLKRVPCSRLEGEDIKPLKVTSVLPVFTLKSFLVLWLLLILMFKGEVLKDEASR